MKFISFLLTLFIVPVAMSQQSVKQPPLKPGAITKVAKFKPPVVRSYLGRNTKVAVVTVDEANQLLSLPLQIRDDQKVSYTVTSYQFMYRKKSIIENEQTGRKEVSFTTVADRFRSTPLPKLWVNNIAGGLQKDEELFFFDIIVSDKQNRQFFAPDLKIKIQ